jgi:hypothetical protein
VPYPFRFRVLKSPTCHPFKVSFGWLAEICLVDHDTTSQSRRYARVVIVQRHRIDEPTGSAAGVGQCGQALAVRYADGLDQLYACFGTPSRILDVPTLMPPASPEAWSARILVRESSFLADAGYEQISAGNADYCVAVKARDWALSAT